MTYEEWGKTVPEAIREDSLWKMAAYRLALFLADLGWHDVTKLVKDRRTLGLSSQLYEALCSISANIAEGYSRGTSRDRARFYEYALGSARESRDWYFKSRRILGEKVVYHRLQLLTAPTSDYGSHSSEKIIFARRACSIRPPRKTLNQRSRSTLRILWTRCYTTSLFRSRTIIIEVYVLRFTLYVSRITCYLYKEINYTRRNTLQCHTPLYLPP
jgi:four helix bundle protein